MYPIWIRLPNIRRVLKKTHLFDDVFNICFSNKHPVWCSAAPDGRYGAMNNGEDDAQSANNNPLARLNRVAGNIRKTNLRSRFVGTIKPFEGFSATASYSYEFVDELRENETGLH